MDEIEKLLSNIGDEDPELKKIINKELEDLNESGEENIEIDLDGVPDQSADNTTEDNSADSSVTADKTSPDTPLEQKEIAAEPENPAVSAIETASVSFNVPGSKSWNTKEPYTLPCDIDSLMLEKKDLENSFYFTEKTETSDELRNNIKTSLLRFIRKPTENITNLYTEFIYKTISTQMDEAILHFNIGPNSKHYFIYHTGPLVVFKILDKVFRVNNTGTCYKQIAVNKSQSFYPSNFIRGKILSWYEENINILSLNFDNFQQYDIIKNTINKNYEKEVKIFNQRLYKLNQKIGPKKSISKEQLLKLKGHDWYGIGTIEIFKRYVDHTIFQGIL